MQARDVTRRGGRRFTLTPDYDMSSWGFMTSEGPHQDYHETAATRIRNVAKRPRSQPAEEDHEDEVK